MQHVTRKQLAQIIGEKTMHIVDRRQLVTAVAAFLSDGHESIDIDSLVRDVMQYRLEHGLVEATAVSAHELTPAVIKDVEDVLKERFPDAQQIIINQRVEPEVVGGVRIELPRETLDLSVRTKLNTLKRLVAEEK